MIFGTTMIVAMIAMTLDNLTKTYKTQDKQWDYSSDCLYIKNPNMRWMTSMTGQPG